VGEGAEPVFAEVLDEVAGLQRVLVDSHFFDDLCADSLAMARFCARVRKREELPSVSMKDIYRNPTIRSFASTPGGTVPAASAEPSVSVLVKQHRPVSTAEYLMRGALQLLFFVGYAYLAGAAAFLIVSAASILAKSLLIGRWTADSFRRWSLAYFRLWLVKSLVRSSQLVLFVGAPLYPLYSGHWAQELGAGL
jgi:hypothetical protein